ncbi:type II toxin-antitoxin system VapC family toxin [Atribacter laminatus]|jgi:predicted nucleic acid-binding protein|uniref:Ribonuclease VapC49 n=1 Tax=Atribacter laminatus TaxID=2847778 RepID=A0A7T1F2I2_ATRLM|nr:type II toxin-antitoxin system VapC family toxin [Atribacter laminatus]QPM67336.1 Ribonuclease VapC49 [Atribacter laminatus]
MIAYFDTSALIKFYIDEKDSDLVKETVKSSEVVFTSKISYVEMFSVFSRIKRDQAITENDYRRILKSFIVDWESYAVIEITNRILNISSQLFEFYPLRSLDALHLGSALFTQKEVDEDIAFVCFDNRLWKAAKEENFKVIPESLND